MDSPIIQISDGKIKGTVKTDSNGERFYAFLSIPYGKPPVGDLRFKTPQPAEPWGGIKDATKQGEVNVQNDFMKNQLVGSEDCLNLHVITKKLPSEEEKLKPVLVWIHGGGFVVGGHDINRTGPDYLLTEDIVLVEITYRLGLFGFLQLQDTSLEVTGNAGLKDQVLALKWVQKNIKNFNGDPNNVTIFGGSAGAASVDYLLLSPTTKNLFHKAIAMSGTALNPWTMGNFDPADFAKFCGLPHSNDKEILNSLKNIPPFELYDWQSKYTEETFGHAFGLITPVIEEPNPTAFIDKHPIDIIQSGEFNKVPIIFGYCDNEGLIFEFMNYMRKMQGKPPHKSFLTEHLLPGGTNFSDSDIKIINDKFKEFYSKEEYKDNPVLLSDSMFVIGILVSAINYAKISKNPVFLYRFSFSGGLNFLKKMGQLEHFPGASHGDDLGYLFKQSLMPTEPAGEAEKLTSRRMVELWTNFSKYGNPTPKGNDLNIEWKPLEGDKINFLDIGKDLVLGVNPENERIEMWKEIFQMDPITAKFL